MSTTNDAGSYVTVQTSSVAQPASEGVASLLAAGDLPVNKVEFIESRGPRDVTSALEDALSLHQIAYVAEAWSRYKSAWHLVATEGGAEGSPVPSTVTTPLCRLDEEAVALAGDAWRAGFRLAMAIAPALAQGGVAVRLPETAVCPECRGYQVLTDRGNGRQETESETDVPVCPECDGEGVVSITPDVLVMGGVAGVLPLPVRVVQT
jgi:hypothetical protein